MKKKDSPSVCIVTGFSGSNYGTKLQSTALCKYFEHKGYNTFILKRFFVPTYFLRHPSLLINRAINKVINRRKTKIFFESVPYEINNERSKRLQQYEDENYKILKIESNNIWKKIQLKNMAFVVGSDILWQPAMGIPAFWFLDFAYFTRLPLFSYATSIGAKHLPKKYYKYYKKYLDKFKEISVRETTAAKMVSEVIHKPVVQMIDPTLLHGVNFWDKYAEKAKIPNGIQNSRFIFCYFVMDDERYWKYIRIVSETTHLPVVVLPMHNRDEEYQYNSTIIFDGTPYEFVWLIKNSAFVCTDSFHACAFSLNYQKEFYLLRRQRNDEDDKYDDFLRHYNLGNRCIIDESKFSRNSNIDFSYALKELERDRELAYDFLDKI